MAEQLYTYVIVGGGLAGASAVQGIRELDKRGSLLLIGNEKHLPYDRPPLTKKLWFGQKKVEDIFIHDQKFYEQNNVQVTTSTKAVKVDPVKKSITAEDGKSYRFEKLLLATGGIPKSLSIPGGDLEGICYYRYLDDYLRIRSEATEGKSAVVIGGGFIGSEIAAALNINKVNVTIIFPGLYLCSRVFPETLGLAIQSHYRERGITILTKDKPIAFKKNGNKFITSTENGKLIESDMLIVGTGIIPSADLAKMAGLKTSNGIEVNEYLQTSNPNIYAAGDNALFPYQALGQQMRVEHWDNALNQGKSAGKNMAGAHEPFNYMPYFFSDLFEFGYEAVGEANAELDIFSDWQKENEKGVIYYLKEGKVKGVMMCNVWEKVDAARDLIRKGDRITYENLRGAIK